VFCLDAGAELPLHDHPGMTVLSRLLYGQLAVRSFDWDDAGGPGAARLAGEVLLSGPAPCRVLRPAQGNLHALHARTPAAVLDVLGPPYEPRAGRGCSYFREEHPRAAAPGDAARLERVPPSPDFLVARSTYRGAHMRVP
jgi:cysteamine dioxygenase